MSKNDSPRLATKSILTVFTYRSRPKRATCGQQNVAGKRILIIYDTKYGATRTIANTIQDVLCAAGAQVDMSIVKRIQDVSTYDAVIVGSAIISEQWRPDLVKFLKDQEEILATKPVAVFIVCGLLKDDTPENREIAKKTLLRQSAAKDTHDYSGREHRIVCRYHGL